MKIIYDNEQPVEKRIEFIGNDGKSYFGFHCFQILLDDGNETANIGNWGTLKKRREILNRFK
jgi:hypothetical protein